MGFMPVAGEEWIYEMTVNCMLEPRSNGVPTWRSDQIGERLMMKLPMQFESIFAESAPLSEDIGEAMARWARGDAPASSSVDPEVLARARADVEAAVKMSTTDPLNAIWKRLKPAERTALGGAERFKEWGDQIRRNAEDAQP